MTEMLFYDKIVPLNREAHRKLRLQTTEQKAFFARGTHYVPLACTEFYQAARDMPIVFVRDGGDKGPFSPIALLGLREGENLFVDESGTWSMGVYAPAFIRRYPFILANAGDDKPMTVCIDESYAGFGEEEGNLLFDADGKETAYLARTVEFLNRFDADINTTRTFVDELQSMDLLASRNLNITDTKGRQFGLNNFYIVDEEKLAKLDDAKLGEWQRKGWLGWIYAHLISLGNANRLPARIGDIPDTAPSDDVPTVFESPDKASE